MSVLIGTGAFLAVCTSVYAADPAAKVDPALERRVEGLLAKLESGNFKEREDAATAIEGLPAAAVSLIEDALSAGALSPEVAIRLEQKVAVLRRNVAVTPYETALRAEFDWNKATSLAAYAGGGHTNPKWDAAVREALVMAVRPRFDPNRSAKEDARILAALRRALDLGCDDPYVLYVYANRSAVAPSSDPRRTAEMMGRAADGVLAGTYPAFRKVMAAARRAEATLKAEGAVPTAGARRDAVRDVDAALALLPAAAKEGAPRGLLLDAAAVLNWCSGTVADDPMAGYDKVAAALAVTAAGSTLSALFDAAFHLDVAQAIDDGTLPFVRRMSAEQRNTLRAASLAAARKSLGVAAVADPADPVPWTETLRALALDGASRLEFEACFAKAMAAYPNNLAACTQKRRFLTQSGSREDLMAFARECVAGGNWASRIPFMMVDVHLSAAPLDFVRDYFAKVGPWDDCHEVYQNYLKRYPNALYDRTMYAKIACWSGQWGVAKAQFDLLGDDGVVTAFNGKQTYDYFRKKADRLAKEAK